VGSDIRFETAWEEQIFKQWGKVLEFNSCKILRYSLFAARPDLEDKPENYFEMQYLLNDENGVTTLEIIQVDNRLGAKQEAPQGEKNPLLVRLKEVSEILFNKGLHELSSPNLCFFMRFGELNLFYASAKRTSSFIC
jgi:hypothetical protein